VDKFPPLLANGNDDEEAQVAMLVDERKDDDEVLDPILHANLKKKTSLKQPQTTNNTCL